MIRCNGSEKRDKLSTRFDPNPYTVLNKHSNSLVVQSRPVQYPHITRTVIHQVQRNNPPNNKVQCRFQMLSNPGHQVLSNPGRDVLLKRGILVVPVPEDPLRRSKVESNIFCYPTTVLSHIGMFSFLHRECINLHEGGLRNKIHLHSIFKACF